MAITFGSLFSGFGGMDLGLERAGLQCAWQVEINDYATRVLQKHWPSVLRFRDVRECGAHNLSPVDLICGGDPCQANSRARTYKGLRSPSLGSDFIRIVDELRPRLVLRENPTRTRADAPWPWQRFRGELERLGYAVLPFRLRACCFGADHQRDRLFLLAERTDADSKSVRWQGQRETFSKTGTDERETRQRQRVWPDIRPVLLNEWIGTDARIRGGVDGIPNRVERLRGLGNAVLPQAAEFIGRLIIHG